MCSHLIYKTYILYTLNSNTFKVTSVSSVIFSWIWGSCGTLHELANYGTKKCNKMMMFDFKNLRWKTLILRNGLGDEAVSRTVTYTWWKRFQGGSGIVGRLPTKLDAKSNSCSLRNCCEGAHVALLL